MINKNKNKQKSNMKKILSFHYQLSIIIKRKIIYLIK